MLILNAQEISRLLSPIEIIEAVRIGFCKYTRGEYHVPLRMHIDSAGLTYLLMPAIGSEYYCTKLVSVLPDNASRNLPMIRGTVTLNNITDGETLAIMDAISITALRTSAVGAIGFDLISPARVAGIGVIGCGIQGIWQTIFAASVRQIQVVYCFSRTKDRFHKYREEVLHRCPDLQIFWCKSADEVVEKSEVIYTCTTSSHPVFSNLQELVSGKKFISVGSYRKDMQELPDLVYQQAEMLLIDTNAAKVEVGDVINAQTNGYLEDAQIIEIGTVLTNDFKGDRKKFSVFKSVGMAAFDLAMAEALYEKAKKSGIGTTVKV